MTAAAPGLSLQVVETVERLQALAPAWRDLLADCPGRNLFLTPAWTLAWWRAFGQGRELRALAWHGAGRLVGLALLMRQRLRLRGLPLRVLSSLSNAHVSRTDLLVAPGWDAVVADGLADYLSASTGDWDVVWLQQLPAQAAWVAPLLDAARRRGLLPAPVRQAVAKCRMPLAGGWQHYVEQRGGHFRRNQGKLERRVARAGSLHFRHSTDAQSADADFATFEQVERRSWKDDAGHDAHLGPAGWAFQRAFAYASEDGIASDNWIVDLDGAPVAIVHTVGHDRVNYCFQTLYDKRVRELYIGRAAVTRHFQSVFDDGRYDTLDFNGDSPFCRSWCDSTAQFISLEIHHRGPYSGLLHLARRWRGPR